MRGRKPQPIAAQIAKGDPRKLGARKLAERLDTEPRAARGLPACPSHLKGIARKAWAEWAEELEAMGLDRRPDGVMLEGACVNYAMARAAEVAAKRLLRIGDPDAYRADAMARARWVLVRSFCSEFGLSPVSRQRLTVEKKDEGEADLMAALAGPRLVKAAV